MSEEDRPDPKSDQRADDTPPVRPVKPRPASPGAGRRGQLLPDGEAIAELGDELGGPA
jgi:hypothetical protein